MSQESTYYAIISGNRIEADSLKELRLLVKQHLKQNNLPYTEVSRLFYEKNGAIVRVFER